MRHHHTVAVVIPALNEARSIGKVLADIPRWVDDVVVVDNGSRDATADIASAAGARVVREPRRGYGSACLTGIAALARPDIVVFLDADYSDHPEDMAEVVDPICDGSAELVIGSRALGERERCALTPQARFGNALSCLLIRLLWGVRYTDLGPFRAIRFATLEGMTMSDRDYGWTVEMQIKAAQARIRVAEVPVRYRKRLGKSKISGTLRGVLGAGTKILSKIFGSVVSRIGTPLSRRKECLIVFTRYPETGSTKTRLIPRLGAVGAAAVQKAMTEHALNVARRLRLIHPVDIEVHFSGGNEALLREWLGNDLRYVPQSAGDLGERMHESLCSVLRRGAKRAVLVGTDAPGIDIKILGEAFRSLRTSDVVLGPTTDGGYYLVGLRRPSPAVFSQMRWSTDRVLADTLQRIREARLSHTCVTRLDDVDRPEDLPHWESVQSSRDARPWLSIVIPALDEAEFLAETLQHVRRSDDVEMIVVDGGSRDATREIAASLGVRALVAAPGRARQMNAGAAEASGDVLLFLHADTRLPVNYEQHVADALSGKDAVGGAFCLGIRSRSAGIRLVERMVAWRSRRLGLPYGDQALFVRADEFLRLGGFPSLPIMEDVEFVNRMKRAGRIVIAPAVAATSARRWLALGVLKTTLMNWSAVLAYRSGASPHRLAAWYRRNT